MYAIISFADNIGKETGRTIMSEAKDARGKKLFTKVVDAKPRVAPKKRKAKNDTNSNSNGNGTASSSSNESSSKRARTLSSSTDNNDNKAVAATDENDDSGETHGASATATATTASEVKSAADICTPLWRYTLELDVLLI